MTLTFYRADDNESEDPVYTAFTASVLRAQRATDKASDVVDAVQKLFLPANTSVQREDLVDFEGKLYSFMKYYPVKYLGNAASHVEVWI